MEELEIPREWGSEEKENYKIGMEENWKFQRGWGMNIFGNHTMCKMSIATPVLKNLKMNE